MGRVAEAPEAITFYRARAPYGWMSNFSRHPIRVQGRLWSTVEHYFQAQKARDEEGALRVWEAPTPAQAKRQGRLVKMRPDWHKVRDDVMLQGVRAKFTQHPGLREMLLATGDALLIEHTANDSYWGDGGDGSGRNRLGEILMQVRSELAKG